VLFILLIVEEVENHVVGDSLATVVKKIKASQ